VLEVDALIVRTFEDLHRSTNSPDEYEVLRASQLIRQLLLDGSNSLVDRVNRTHKLKLKYLAVPVTPPSAIGSPSTAPWCALDEIDPCLDSTGSPPVEFRWDKFQKLIVAASGGHTHSVHDIIDYLAHIAGGVHIGIPSNDRERVLAALESKLPGLAISPIAVTLRAIGRIILRGLSELRDRVVGVDRFEDGPGLSLYLALILAPMEGGQENYILDLGSELAKNRITVFLDAHGDLCVRIFSPTGNMHTLQAGCAGGAYRYGEPIYIACEIGRRGDSLLVNVGSNSWNLARVYTGTEGPDLGSAIPVIVGSDVRGRCQTNMRVMEHVLFLSFLSHENRWNMRDYLACRLAKGYEQAIEFEPGAFMYSIGHPNLPATKATGSGLVSTTDPPPRLRKL
jgi:hypothetical protein